VVPSYVAAVLLAAMLQAPQGGSQQFAVGAGSNQEPAGEALLAFEEPIDDGAPLESAPFYRLLALAAQVPEAVWSRRAPVVEVAMLRASPRLYRGRMVECPAVVLEVVPLALPGNPSGFDRVLEVHCVDGADAILTAVLLDDSTGWTRGDRVLVRGIFLKIRGYQSRGGTWEEAPLLVTRSLLPRTAEETGGGASQALVRLIIAVGLALGGLAAVRYQLGRSGRTIRFKLPGRKGNDEQ